MSKLLPRSRRTFSTILVFSALALGGTALGLGASASAGDEESPECTTKKFEFKDVEAACKKGGRKAAKTLMKSVVKKAKADGQKIKCTNCHKDLKAFENTPNAVEDLKKLGVK